MNNSNKIALGGLVLTALGILVVVVISFTSVSKDIDDLKKTVGSIRELFWGYKE